MKNTIQKLILKQETVRILALAPVALTTLPICPTGFDPGAGYKGKR